MPDRSASATRFASPLSYTPPHLADKILGARSALEGEHKRVTVLFCDIANSSTLAERLGEERMYEFLSRFFDHSMEEVHHYNGTVNQFLGDGFMALFGAPLAQERHERHAILAALAIRARLAEHLQGIAKSAGMEFEVRMGVNTGLVVVGKIGDNLRMDYTAVGGTTHVAARLQAMAAPGEILIAPATFEATRSAVDTQSLGPVSLKGMGAPIEVHRVTGVRAVTVASQAQTGRTLSRFVGREHELSLVMDALEEAESGRGRAVCIVSEPGMGKSRMLWEFRQQLNGRRVDFLEGQCLSYGATMPFLPVLDLVRGMCQLVDVDPPEVACSKVMAAVAEQGLDPAAAVPYLQHLLGIGDPPAVLVSLTPEVIQARATEALRQLCRRRSRKRPQVVVIEDLQWVDRSSEDFIGLLADSLAGAAILLIVTYRPGYSPTWIDKSYASQIALRPLSQSNGLAIVQAALASRGTPPPVALDIVSRAEGNPLFLEELSRAVSERIGSVVAAVPDTLQGVLAARIDRLPDPSKRLLQKAAVIGREFSARLLALLWQEGGPLDEELLRLTRLEFVFERESDNETVYVFKHALTRDAAYASLLGSRRRVLHGWVGAALEQIHTARIEDAIEVLAHHYGQSDQDEKAVDYAVRAADRAAARWANAEALAFSEAAQQRLEAMPATDANRLRRIDVVIKQTEVRFAMGQHAAQMDALARIEPLLRPSDDPARRAAWHYWMGFLHSVTGGRTEASIAHCVEASEIAQAADLEDLRASADACLAQAYLVCGELRKAIEIGERALAVFEQRNNHWWACRALAQMSPAANGLGEWQRSLAYCSRALEHGIAMDDLRLKVSAYVRLASTQIQRGDWQSGLAYCEQAQALSPVQYDAAALRAIRGYAWIKAGRACEGTEEIAGALVWYDKSHQRYTHTLFSIWLAEGLVRASAVDEALVLLERALATCAELGYRHLLGLTHRLLAECHRQTDPGAATDHLRRALGIIDAIGARSEMARIWLVATSFANELVDSTRSSAVREQALGQLRELGTIELG